MADPLSMLAIGSMALSAGGQVYKGVAQSNMYAYQSGVAQMNRNIALENAKYSREVGEVKAEVAGMKTRGAIGTATAKQEASGFSVAGGSATDVRESIHMLGQFDQANERATAAKAAYGHEVEAANFQAESEMYKSAKTTSLVSSFIGAASSVSDKWLQYNNMFGSKSAAGSSNPTKLFGLY
jgi:hypothetical protein